MEGGLSDIEVPGVLSLRATLARPGYPTNPGHHGAGAGVDHLHLGGVGVAGAQAVGTTAQDETAVLDAVRPGLTLGGPETPRLPRQGPTGNFSARRGDVLGCPPDDDGTVVGEQPRAVVRDVHRAFPRTWSFQRRHCPGTVSAATATHLRCS